MLKTLVVKSFVADMWEKQCLEVSSRGDISVVSGGQLHAWSLPRYPTDKLFPYSLALVVSADVVLDLTTGMMQRNLLEANLSNNQAMSLYLDPTLSPEDEHHDAQRRSFKTARWSSPVLGATECLLATLQNDHNLRIHRFVQQEWKTVLNIAENFADFVRSELRDEISQLRSYSVVWEYFIHLRSIVYRMAITNFAWARPAFFERRIHILLALKNGSLRFATVQVAEEALELSFSPSICKPLETEPGPMFTAVVCLRCVALSEDSFLVLAGYSNGMCFAVRVQRDATYEFGQCATLWSEDDDISAKDMFVAVQEDRIVVTIIKGLWLCIATLDVNSYQLVGDVVTVRTAGRSDCLSCHETNMFANEECLQRLFLVYPNGKSLLAEVAHDLTVEVRDLGLEVTAGYQVYGSGESANGALLYIIERMSAMSDKLLLTGANKLKVISTVPLDSAAATILHMFREEQAALHHIKDYLDIVYLSFQSTQRLPEDLTRFIRECSDPDNICRLTTPQILLSSLILQWSPQESPNSVENSDTLARFAHEVLRRRYHFLLTNNYSQEGLTDAQHKSLVHFADFLLASDPDLIEKVYRVLKVAPSTCEQPKSRDSCELCGEPVLLDLNAVSSGVCSRGHQTGRCMYSLLLCRTADLMSKCLTCGRFALRNDVWERPVECLLCGLSMIPYP
ncbi:hypothetical protein BIW11_14175 [Tropilaelaps mercedesae]|uniref:Transcription factor IIIC 90kDa subunit N-terminal domain-containing protein n=1 Tax=Tropilaelaps mercedesae TaxID=418985 RepID=A0A1V9WYQ7_9ACAR|nr:hypothetical protein BIW11_14175 [Tropilaelaps mercedesae]